MIHEMNDGFEERFETAARAGREAARTEPRATGATYDAQRGLVMVELATGIVFGFPPRMAIGLENATPEQLADVQVDPGGYGLHWEALDADVAVPGLIFEALNARAWWARHIGGQSTPRKADSARTNGRLGGRPRAVQNVTAGTGFVQVQASAGGRTRRVTVRTGGRYRVDPLNPRAQKFRGRTGVVVGVQESRGRVRLRFDGTGGEGLVNPSDLVPETTEQAGADRGV